MASDEIRKEARARSGTYVAVAAGTLVLAVPVYRFMAKVRAGGPRGE